VRFRNLTHCKHGHPFSEARIRHYKGWTVRDCLCCEEIRWSEGGTMKPEAVVKMTAALARLIRQRAPERLASVV
jgi:hypothetical protein